MPRCTSKTFEYDLALESESNVITMAAIYKHELAHPDIGQKIMADLRSSVSNRDRAKVFFQPSLGKHPREKGRFAQKLAAYLEPEGEEFSVPMYIQDAIYHAIDVYTLYTDGLVRLLSSIGNEHSDYADIASKQGDLEAIVSDIHQQGTNDDLRNRLSLLINEIDNLCKQANGPSFSFRQFCGLK